jgi:hypothetical protein
MTDMTEIFTWTETDDAEDGEGTILAITLPGFLPLNLITRNRAIAEGLMRKVALDHHERTGHRVRLVRWTAREDVEELP